MLNSNISENFLEILKKIKIPIVIFGGIGFTSLGIWKINLYFKPIEETHKKIHNQHKEIWSKH